MSSFALKVLMLVCCGAGLAHGAVVFGYGGCPDVATKSNFDKSQYLGKWYEYERFNNWFENGLKCGFADYTDNGDGSIGVRNGGVKIRNGKEEIAEGKATVPDSDKPGELKVSFSNFDFTTAANYMVMDTDYSSYVLIFSCSNVPLVPVTFQTVWILTRTRGAKPGNLDTLKETLESYGIPSDRLQFQDQTGCSNQ